MSKVTAKELPDAHLYFTQVDIARIVDRTPKTIIEWEKKFGLTKHESGKYYLPDFIKWYERFTMRDVNQVAQTKEEADIRLIMLKADLAELELMEKRGVLVNAAEATAIVYDVALRVKTRLDGFLRKCEVSMVGKSKEEIRAIIDAERRDIFRELQTIGDDLE